MVHFYRSNAHTIPDASIVLIGMPDESKSHAKRKGTHKAPDVIRLASNNVNFRKRR